MFIYLLLLLVIIFVIVSTSKWNLHPLFSLLIGAFFFGFFSGMEVSEIISSITKGFGNTIGSVGLIIILGIIIGTFLEKSGAALKLANRLLEATGKNKVHTSNALIGYLISIPVFADSGFLILSSLNKAISKKAGLSLAGTVAALALGLLASHTMVPPTPGPIAAAGILEADLGLVFVFGVSASLIALIAGIFFSRYIGRKIWIDPKTDVSEKNVKDLPTEPSKYSPSAFKSVLPLVVPIILILLNSVAQYPTNPFGEGMMVEILSTLGNPIIALFIGVLLSITLPEKLEKSMFGSSGWVGEAIKSAATIILITGAGGALGNVLQNSDLGAAMSESITETGYGLLIPFLIAAAFKTAQGSSTVAIITSASIMAPLLLSMGMDSAIDKAMVVSAIGAGALVVSHANDSYFWVVTQLSDFDVNTGYKIHTTGTLVLGITAISFLLLVDLFI